MCVHFILRAWLQYPYCPPHITKPKEKRNLYAVILPEKGNTFVFHSRSNAGSSGHPCFLFSRRFERSTFLCSQELRALHRSVVRSLRKAVGLVFFLVNRSRAKVPVVRGPSMNRILLFLGTCTEQQSQVCPKASRASNSIPYVLKRTPLARAEHEKQIKNNHAKKLTNLQGIS